MREIRLRLKHDCDVAWLSGRHPDIVMAGWCNWKLDILELRTHGGELAPPLARDLDALARKGFERLGTTPGPEGAVTVVMTCGHPETGGPDQVVERHGGVVLDPTLYENGVESYRILIPDERRARAMVKDLARLGEVEVTVNKEWTRSLIGQKFAVATDDLLGNLTPKQGAALLTAIQAGYYKVPRKVRSEDIARRRNIPRTTFEEHVRKAESKVLLGMAPYLAAWLGDPRAALATPRRRKGKGASLPAGADAAQPA